MEEIVEYGFRDIEIPKNKFMAKFDPNTGSVVSVGPSIAFENEVYKVSIDEEIALKIIEGTISLSSCVVNIDNDTVELSEVRSLFKIDDVLHRITEKKYSDTDIIDMMIQYDANKQTFKFSLSEELGGTFKNLNKKDSKKNRKTIWSGETVMQFYITDYNDPNVLYQIIQIHLDELKNKEITILADSPPKKFSVYTRRLFKNYILEII